jgi:hypothetical protein
VRGEVRKAYIILVKKPEGKRTLQRLRYAVPTFGNVGSNCDASGGPLKVVVQSKKRT